MEIVKGRGINCENEVYFDYVDGKIVMTMYKDMVGVRMDRRDPNVIKAFSIDQWEEINGYLRETLDDVEGVFDDGDDGEDEVAEEEEATIDRIVPLTASMVAEDAGLPKVVGNIPSMTKDNKEDNKENGKENNEDNSETETSP